MKRTPLRRRSKKRIKLMREERAPFVAKFLDMHRWCQRCSPRKMSDPDADALRQEVEGHDPVPAKRSTVVHEKLTRARGGSITDPENCAAVCGPCHDEIHLHPRQATEDGWLKHRWEK